MRIVFIGRRNFANHCFANWLSHRHEVVAYFRADMKRYTSGHRREWLRKRVARGGVLRTLDQVLFQIHYNLFQQKMNERLLRQTFAAKFGLDAFDLPPAIPRFEFADLNGAEALSKLAELKPDLAFAVCISQYLRKPYQEIPRFGTVLYHEGLTPEYRGLHTAFWANLRGEADRIGYTLLQLSDEIDAGRPVAQGVGTIDPALAQWWGYAGHQALIDGLPAVESALASIAAGRVVVSIPRQQGPPGMFSYPGLSDEIRRLWRRRPQS